MAVRELAHEWNKRNSPPLDHEELDRIVTDLAKKDAARLAQFRPIEAIDDPDQLARLCLHRLWKHPDGWALRWHNHQWYLWTGHAYRDLWESELNARLVREIKAHFDRKSIEAQARLDGKGSVARQVKRELLGNVRLALQSKIMVPSDLGVPCWLGIKEPWPAHQILACTNGLFHLSALAEGREEKLALTPGFFSTFALDFEIRLDASRPTLWLAFLNQLWPKDLQSIEALQEWFGYCLTQDTRQQKILMLIGPPRSGKGTIARVLTSIIGRDNVAGPTLSSFKGEFGLQALLGKTLGIVPDARLKGQTEIVVERLLSISGEDLLTVNRKNQPQIAVKLPTRLVLISNELPRFDDSSGALVSRMIFLNLTESFLGRENPNLMDQLLPERSGILLWAIAGWKRLHERGHFVQPDSAKEMLRELEELSSPIKAFVNDRCVFGPWLNIKREELYAAYVQWCEENGRKYPDARNTFGRNLRAAFPRVGDTQPVEEGERVRLYEGIALKRLEKSI